MREVGEFFWMGGTEGRELWFWDRGSGSLAQVGVWVVVGRRVGNSGSVYELFYYEHSMIIKVFYLLFMFSCRLLIGKQFFILLPSYSCIIYFEGKIFSIVR